jgi:hypothetical protein
LSRECDAFRRDPHQKTFTKDEAAPRHWCFLLTA